MRNHQPADKVYAMADMMKKLVVSLDAFDSHYNAVAKEISEIAANEGLDYADVINSPKLSDAALKAVIPNREEYMEFANADMNVTMLVENMCSITGKTADDERELLMAKEKLPLFHKERADRLYGGWDGKED
ncbi:MAG: hypothetical protein HZB68_05845 [Candidatus Aenigmarchaeota archaeon]|nr:hypothetical protein [Candidatus Aenigmarchaeota archaeon]